MICDFFFLIAIGLVGVDIYNEYDNLNFQLKTKTNIAICMT